MPHRHVPDFTALDAAERDELAVLYRDLLRRCDALYGTPLPYGVSWHQAPTGNDLLRLHLSCSPSGAPPTRSSTWPLRIGHGRLDQRRLPEDIAARLRAVG